MTEIITATIAIAGAIIPMVALYLHGLSTRDTQKIADRLERIRKGRGRNRYAMRKALRLSRGAL